MRSPLGIGRIILQAYIRNVNSNCKGHTLFNISHFTFCNFFPIIRVNVSIDTEAPRKRTVIVCNAGKSNGLDTTGSEVGSVASNFLFNCHFLIDSNSSSGSLNIITCGHSRNAERCRRKQCHRSNGDSLHTIGHCIVHGNHPFTD